MIGPYSTAHPLQPWECTLALLINQSLLSKRNKEMEERKGGREAGREVGNKDIRKRERTRDGKGIPCKQ